jgi:hypothetical protein
LLDRERITEEEIPLGLPDKLKLRGKDPDLFHSEENLLDTAAMFFTHVLFATFIHHGSLWMDTEVVLEHYFTVLCCKIK